LVFMPVMWQTDQDSFEQVAHIQANTFIRESHIDTLFNVIVEILSDGPKDVSLTDPELDIGIDQYGLEHKPGDRYIGITDSDLAPNGNNDIAGWTSDGQAVVEESADPYITSHELGHTFGLCDEYNLSEWTRENEEFPSGCPNPYPSSCPQTMADGVICDGTPTTDGYYSIMGPAGLLGAHGYNSPSLDHLLQAFSELASQR